MTVAALGFSAGVSGSTLTSTVSDAALAADISTSGVS